ncbi:MAG: hypothetical protein J5582_15605 [Ruminococcus sp.]|uniref:hypothetical protein n=1 Tax=Ruminococcus sp. TaxID=41978 RepID=UPI0025EB4D6C|nr:hypothetical protein [Ruminococcus sp.]MBO4867966.1 hypothetical protein [Ruminococcus sp.]
MTPEERQALIEKIAHNMYLLGIRTEEQADAFIRLALAHDPYDRSDESFAQERKKVKAIIKEEN